MEKELALKEVQANIAAGRTELVGPQIMDIVETYSNEPFTLLTCASLLRVTGDDKLTEQTVRKIFDCLPESENTRFEIAQALYNLGYAPHAIRILEDLEETDEVLRCLAKSYYNVREFVSALGALNRLPIPTIEDDVFRVEVLISVGNMDKALEVTEGLMSEGSELFEVQRSYCSALVAAGRIKDAEKFVKGKLKEDKGSADNNALVAYMMWILGKTNAAGAHAAKALGADPKHICAMEILGLSLADKKKIDQARIVAGAINEISPGNPAVMRILDLCKQGQ